MKFTRRDEPKGDGGNFLKIEDGKSITGLLRGEVYEFYQRWPQGEQKQTSSEPFPGASLRFKVNIVVHENGKFVAKVWEFGTRVNNMLATIAEDCPLDTTKIKITRNGSGKNTSWTVMPSMKEPLSAKQLKEIAAVDLNILGEVSQSEPQDDDSEVPF